MIATDLNVFPQKPIAQSDEPAFREAPAIATRTGFAPYTTNGRFYAAYRGLEHALQRSQREVQEIKKDFETVEGED